MKKYYLFSALLIFLDQISKIIISLNFRLNEKVEVINNFFYITLKNNTGAAFSILEGKRLFFVLISVVFFVIIYFLYKKETKKIEKISYILITGGLIGNLIDRIIYGYVIDFIDLNIFGYEFAIFNLADIFIVIGSAIYIIQIIREELCKNTK